MSVLPALLERHAPPTSGPRADRGRAWLLEHGLPSSRDEAWRYTPVTDIVGALETAVPAPPRTASPTRSVVDDLAGVHGGPRLVFVNGELDRATSDLEAVAGVWLGNRDGMRRRPPSARAAADEPADGFHALNWAAGRDVAAIVIDAGAQSDDPIHVVHLAVPGAATTATHPRTVVLAGAGSRAHVIEAYVGLPGPALTNASTRIVAADGAALTYHRIQGETPTAVHVGRTSIAQGAGTRVVATSIMAGARIARSAVHVGFDGSDARADVSGLYVPSGQQRHDNVVTVDHRRSGCTSAVAFRGIVAEHGRGSFSGHVIVRPGTTGTDAHQSNRNLVIDPTAQADTRPWLEIFADDVRCTHGATVGRLDDDALFYLRSRGIPLGESRAMLVDSFAAEIVDALGPSSLRDHVARLCRRPV